jgi:hypothetical protein
MESSREDDPELANIRELFELGVDYLNLDQCYIDAVTVDSLKALDPERPIREADC